MSTSYTMNGDLRIAYEDHGGHGGDPLLLVMGTAFSRFWWPPKFIATLVEAGFHVASYDHRDAGESDRWPDQPKANPIASQFRKGKLAYTAAEQASDGVAVLNALGWDGAHLFGHSMGGLVAQHIALGFPGVARTVTTSAAVPAAASRLGLLRYVRPGVLVKLSRAKYPRGPEGDVAAAIGYARMLAAPDYPLDEEYAREAAERDRACGIDPRDTQAQARQTGARWSGPGPEALTVPLLSFHGDADPLLRLSAARDLTAAAPDSRLIVVPGVGHTLPGPLFADYVAEVRRHVDRWATSAPRLRFSRAY
ncbi:alpha/beta fold hydrolase [Stackebrandtia nassauensis]|uniref:Alpha/beta hydrolase fold protein n=1 Tax=Stackebrandtia nassauensis (strain DSM 44728 / CIP 108903 / NRRL B-16338 / NBRC 102104 / LLR-40K-21) TaxID=446470 RepID=D3Q2Z9_STANL|nr:alpha/beta fold hydrolase [Stackebrandtia nassauensis]ADD39969.1 alpha/beta hydrolase fold protein [Stackebrandtia nassauensis DSM 44728]